MRNKRFNGDLYSLLVGLILLMVTFAYFGLAKLFPYYFIFDMDHTTTIDTILINSQVLPAHINHPGFGMYLILSLSHRLAAAFHWISVLGLSDLRNSLNPLLGLAELTDYLRNHSIFIAIASIIFIWLTTITIFPVSNILKILCLCLLCSQSAFFYHVTMIRSELYAIFFWSISMYCVANSIVSQTTWKRAIWIVGSGIFLGLCHLSKIQALLYLVTLPVFYFFFASFFSTSDEYIKKSQSRLKYLAVCNAFLFIVLLIAAHFRHNYGEAFTDSFRINIVGIGAAFLSSALAFVELKRESLVQWIKKFTHFEFFHYLLAGYFFAFLFHLLIFSNFGLSLKYLLLDAKMVFFRTNYFLMFGINALLYNFRLVIAYNPLLYCFNILLAFLVTNKIKNQRAKICFLILHALAYLNIFLGTRANLRDLLFAETLVHFLTLISFLILFSRLKQNQLKALLATLVIAQMAQNICKARDMLTRLNLNYEEYGWNVDKEFSNVYGYGQLLFSKVMDEKFPPADGPLRRKLAVRESLKYQSIGRDVQYAFPTREVNLQNISVLEKGFSVWNEAQEYIIDELPDSLHGAIVVSSRGLIKKALALPENLTSGHETLLQIRNHHQSEDIPVLYRSDLDIYLVAANHDLQQLSIHDSEPIQDAKIILKSTSTSEKKSLSILRFKKEAYLKNIHFSEPYFWIIQQKYL